MTFFGQVMPAQRDHVWWWAGLAARLFPGVPRRDAHEARVPANAIRECLFLVDVRWRRRLTALCSICGDELGPAAYRNFLVNPPPPSCALGAYFEEARVCHHARSHAVRVAERVSLTKGRRTTAWG